MPTPKTLFDLTNTTTITNATDRLVVFGSGYEKDILYTDLLVEVAADFVASPATYDLATLHTDGKLLASQVRYGGLVFLGTSTVAALPDPSTLTAGEFYVITTGGTLWSNTWTTGEAAISDGTLYSVSPSPTKQIGEGGTGATTAAAARTNLDVMATADVNDRQLSKAPSNALDFDGSSDYVDFTDNALFEPPADADFSVSFYIKYDVAPAGSEYPIAKRPASSAGYFISINSSGRIIADIADSGSGSATSVDDGADLGDGKWHHCAVTFDRDGNMTRYVGGVVYGSVTDISGQSGSLANSAALELGRVQGGSYFDGQISSVTYYNRLLTSAEVLRLSINGNVPEIVDQWGGALGGVYTSDFSAGVDGFTNVGTTTTGNYDSGDAGHADTLRIVAVDGSSDRAEKASLFTAGQRYRIELNYRMIVGTSGLISAAGVVLSGALSATSWTSATYEFVSTNTDPLRVYAANSGSASDEILIDGIVITEVGAVLSLNPDNIQSDGDWIDASSNELNGTATGATPLMVPPQTSGTFTPVISFTSVNTGVTHDTQVGRWTKINEKTVFIGIQVKLSALGSGSGNVRVTGLPFTSATTGVHPNTVALGGNGFTGLTGSVSGVILDGNTIINLNQWGATGFSSLTQASMTNTSLIQMGFVYEIA
jgi:hypothetical protein